MLESTLFLIAKKTMKTRHMSTALWISLIERLPIKPIVKELFELLALVHILNFVLEIAVFANARTGKLASL